MKFSPRQWKSSYRGRFSYQRQRRVFESTRDCNIRMKSAILASHHFTSSSFRKNYQEYQCLRVVISSRWHTWMRIRSIRIWSVASALNRSKIPWAPRAIIPTVGHVLQNGSYKTTRIPVQCASISQWRLMVLSRLVVYCAICSIAFESNVSYVIKPISSVATSVII